MHPTARLAAVSLLASACTRSGDASSTFSGGSQSGPGDPASASTSNADTSSSTTRTTTTESGEDSAPGTTADTSGILDVGIQPDFMAPPVGCKGKIDLLFVISSYSLMKLHQEQLVLAVPQFIDAIESQFADFDYHIMVVDGDYTWGAEPCTDSCPTLECKVGEDCCDVSPCNCPTPIEVGDPCCPIPDYPCDLLDLVTACDSDWGGGTVMPAGEGASNKLCAIDGGRRYLVKGQSDLDETFKCIALVGSTGGGYLGQALTAAVQKPINDLGGCNRGFLREDALLMVTLISNTWDPGGGALASEGTPADWAQAVLDAKGGDERSVVMLNIGDPDCEEGNGLCHLTNMFPFHHQVDIKIDFGPGFTTAANLVDTACAEFVPPPG